MQIPALVSLSLIGEDYLERDIAIALCSLMLNESATSAVNSAEMGKGKRNILEMGALGALNSLARSDQDELQVWCGVTCVVPVWCYVCVSAMLWVGEWCACPVCGV